MPLSNKSCLFSSPTHDLPNTFEAIKFPQKMASPTSTSAVLDTTELLETIVLHLNTFDFVHAKLVNRNFYNTISKSSAITHELLFPTTPPGLVPFVPNPIGTHEFSSLIRNRSI
ncbi:unnamed protein product [Zymoseptoria tritici ST99CH_1A5]|uniref:F-box domain-containing protein n=1 Tax=Zymoseptoria tritici ST99CH_1A5 TaxID=1276529 RepID=A0A1Y6LV83_ZYMTR|nr:unnamed protein product [Zymoseptoria tritici ST99CH_1A5]